MGTASFDGPPRRHWIGVACAEHVARGRGDGFMQVCHGKGAPLKRLRAGDTIAYYSPGARMGEGASLQAFTAIGVVTDASPHQADMGGGFTPWRRQVRYTAATSAPIRPLLDALALTAGRRAWGAVFRYGLVEVSAEDMRCIAQAMDADLDALGLADAPAPMSRATRSLARMLAPCALLPARS
jgi:hypothetical protein